MGVIKYRASHQTNQAVALLGGATGQSYRTVSLNASPAVFEVTSAGAGMASSDLLRKSSGAHSEAGSQLPDKPLPDTSVQFMSSKFLSMTVLEDQIEQPKGLIDSKTQNSELMSRFENISFGADSSTEVGQTAFPVVSTNADDGQELTAIAGNGFSLLDFIEQAIAQAEASQQQFETTFDGSRQGEFRELLVGLGTQSGAAVREFLQDNIAGSGRDLLSSTVDATGVDLLEPVVSPVLNIDYYARSAELLNGVIETVVQPIGSVAVPQLGPLLANPREELSAYFS